MSNAAIDSATAQMANTTLNESSSTGGDKATNASQNEAVIQSAAEGRRLYIGNLAYATSEEELKDFFKEYLIETTSIPVNPRTSRPVGYAFVDVSTSSEADRAVSELNGKTILDRKVSVQLARKPEEAAPAGTATENTNGETPRRRNSTRGRGRGRGRNGRGARGGRARDGEEATTDAPADPAPTNVPAQVLPLTEATNESSKAQPGAEGTESNDAAKAPRAPRQQRQRGPPEDGVPSKQKVMVANLPYDLKEEKLLEIFKDYSPTSAKLALRPIPRFMVRKLQARNEPRKGRGFAFVTLASEELQQKAISEMNGKEIDGRELAVKVAIDSPGKEDDVNSESNKENGAAASSDDAGATDGTAVAA